MASMRQRRLVASIISVAILGLVIGGYLVLRAASPSLTPAEQAALATAKAAHALLVKETRAVDAAVPMVNVVLPKKSGVAAPGVPTTLFRPGMAPHEVWSFLPYYALGGVTQAELTSSSAVIFSGLCVAADGSIDQTPGECGNDAAAFNSAAFSSFVSAAHQVGTHVLLSLNAFSDATIAPLVEKAAKSASTLSAAVLPLISANGLDGINIDIEGSNPAEAAGFATFVRDFTHDLRVGDPTIELVLDSYAASAAGGPNFFRVGALARFVDRVFAEAYQLNSNTHASANSPLSSPTLGYSVVQTILQYEKVMPSNKLIVGVPFYGLPSERRPSARRAVPSPACAGGSDGRRDRHRGTGRCCAPAPSIGTSRRRRASSALRDRPNRRGTPRCRSTTSRRCRGPRCGTAARSRRAASARCAPAPAARQNPRR